MRMTVFELRLLVFHLQIVAETPGSEERRVLEYELAEYLHAYVTNYLRPDVTLKHSDGR